MNGNQLHGCVKAGTFLFVFGFGGAGRAYLGPQFEGEQSLMKGRAQGYSSPLGRTGSREQTGSWVMKAQRPPSG